MRRTRATAIVLAAVLAGLGCTREKTGAPPPSAPAGPTTPLFNGRDLAGWVQVLDSKWTVEDGALVSRQNPAGRRQGESWLITERDFGDFFLTLKFKVTPGGNSGVFLHDPLPRAERLRAADGGKPPWDAGFEANINATEPNYPTGSIWDIAKGKQGLEKPGEWNDMAIKVQDDQVWTWVNGQLAVDAVQHRSPRGAIGLQRHGTPQYKDKVVWFKDIVIQEIK
jgi:Domain of Unknown Function (DUF1080)